MPGTALTFADRARSAGYLTLPDNDQWECRVEVRSETSDRLYTVARNKRTQAWGCSCPGWRSHRTCKHLTVMVPALTRLAAPEAAPPAPPARLAAPRRFG